MHPQVQKQAEELARLYAGATVIPLPDQRYWVTVPDVDLPPGWTSKKATVYFVIPVGYPQARLDCFYADAGLRLHSGAMPTNANMQNSPRDNQSLLWFSWHVSNWDPNNDNLTTYVNVIKRRFSEAR